MNAYIQFVTAPLIKGLLCIICIFCVCEQLIEKTKENRFIYLRETKKLRVSLHVCMSIIIRVDNGEDVRL